MSLRLRPFEPGDAPEFQAAVVESIPDLKPWMPWAHDGYTLEEARTWVTLQAQQFANGVEYEFAIVDGDGIFAGACGLNQLDPRNRRANIGYWMRSSRARRGIMTEAVKQLLEWAQKSTDFHRFEIVVAIGNVASIRVAEKVSATREAVLRDRILLHETFHDAVMFAITR